MKFVRTHNVAQIGTIVVILGLSILVVLFSSENSRLKRQLAKLTGPPETLKVSEVVPLAKLRSLDGRPLDLSFNDRARRSILFVFSTTCLACERSLAPWMEIADSALLRGLDVYSVSIHDPARTRAYVEEHGLRGSVLAVRDTSFSKDFKIVAVPQTIVINPAGAVDAIWIGLIDSSKFPVIQQQIVHVAVRSSRP